jgi:hypothetical protein
MARLGDMLEKFLQAQDRRTDEALRKAGVDVSGGVFTSAETSEARDLIRSLNELGRRDDQLQSWTLAGQNKINPLYVDLKLPIVSIPPSSEGFLTSVSGIPENVLADDVASVSFTIPQNFTHLMLFDYGRSSVADWNDTIALRFNGDTAANYHQIDISAGGAVALNSAAFTGITYVTVGAFEGQTANANSAAGAFVVIPHYRSAFWKTVLTTAGMEADNAGTQSSFKSNGYWRGTDAVTSITLSLVSASNFKAGSVFSLMGIL